MSKISETELFELLKKAILKRFFELNSASSEDISDWKGQDIVNFQEDVFKKTKSTVSEKWFYTYFKSDFKKLPRIDMLNILSQYAGYSGWAEFCSIQSGTENEEENETKEKKETETIEIKDEKVESKQIDKQEKVDDPIVSKQKINLKTLLLWSSLILIVFITASYFAFFYQKSYEFCFYDADRNTLITEPIEITVARQNFTPLELFAEKGCIEFSSKEDTLLMTIKSTYYKQDTFKIDLRLYQGKETIRLQPDDYKVMLRHYSKSSQSVKERIKMLDQMIDDKALIYQVYDNEFFGVEVLSKKQYINLMSLPTTSLKNFTLIEAEKNKNGKIIKIKFKINSDEE